MNEAHVPPPWKQLLERLRALAPGRVYVSGAQDRGKSTLSRLLVNELSKAAPAALVDADPGQGELGPPATMGWAAHGHLDEGPVELRFVGATSPGLRFLSSVSALHSLVESAEATGARWTVIDSCGWVSASGGERFQLRCLDVLRPEHIIVLQQGSESEQLLAKVDRRFLGCIHRLNPSPEARCRSPEERQSRREERFRQWLARASEIDIPLDGLKGKDFLRGTPHAQWQNRLVAACGLKSQVCVLGIVRGYEAGLRLRVLGRILHEGTIASIQLGEHRVGIDGRHD